MIVRGGKGKVAFLRSNLNNKVQDLITEVRDNVSEFEPEYYTDERILRWLNRAHERVYNELSAIDRRHFSKQSNISFVTDTQEYALPSDFKKMVYVRRVKSLAGPSLNFPAAFQKIDFLDQDRFRQEVFSNNYYYLRAGFIGFVPAPKQNETQNIEITYIPHPTKLTVGGTFEIPLEYGNLLVLYASYMALRSEKEAGQPFLQDFMDNLRLIVHEQALRDASWPDNIRSTDWND